MSTILSLDDLIAGFKKFLIQNKSKSADTYASSIRTLILNRLDTDKVLRDINSALSDGTPNRINCTIAEAIDRLIELEAEGEIKLTDRRNRVSHLRKFSKYLLSLISSYHITKSRIKQRLAHRIKTDDRRYNGPNTKTMTGWFLPMKIITKVFEDNHRKKDIDKLVNRIIDETLILTEDGVVRFSSVEDFIIIGSDLYVSMMYGIGVTRVLTYTAKPGNIAPFQVSQPFNTKEIVKQMSRHLTPPTSLLCKSKKKFAQLTKLSSLCSKIKNLKKTKNISIPTKGLNLDKLLEELEYIATIQTTTIMKLSDNLKVKPKNAFSR